MEALFERRWILAGLFAAAALALFRNATRAGSRPIPAPSAAIAPWLRAFRSVAQALGCAAIAAGLVTGQLWLIGLGLAFGLEETMETSVCLSALSSAATRRELPD